MIIEKFENIGLLLGKFVMNEVPLRTLTNAWRLQ